MSIYAVGDIQGCYDALQCLLEQIEFEPGVDQLWVAGDLVNRGPKSLKTLRFLKSLGDSATVVLGNHDLHLLAIAYETRKPNHKDTFDKILGAKDRDELMDWLRHQPLLHYDVDTDYLMVHAGIPPQWSLPKAIKLSQEVEAHLVDDPVGFLSHMYGNTPEVWHDDLEGWDRLRVITNYLTRMRVCDADGQLDLAHKSGPGFAPKGFRPWFAHHHRKTHDTNILFGHWAALEGKCEAENVFALDTGCVWGGKLTMMRLQDQQFFSCACPSN